MLQDALNNTITTSMTTKNTLNSNNPPQTAGLIALKKKTQNFVHATVNLSSNSSISQQPQPQFTQFQQFNCLKRPESQQNLISKPAKQQAAAPHVGNAPKLNKFAMRRYTADPNDSSVMNQSAAASLRPNSSQ